MRNYQYLLAGSFFYFIVFNVGFVFFVDIIETSCRQMSVSIDKWVMDEDEAQFDTEDESSKTESSEEIAYKKREKTDDRAPD